jgi:hypothetical protein
VDNVYYLEIEDGDGLTQVSLVQSPAIEEDFHFFSAEQFVEPTSGETEQEFISRCIPVLIGEGKEQEQAAAICYSYWEDKEKLSSFSDYPQAARDNAERGIRLNEAINNRCATQVGKVRAQQIASGEALSEETVKRTYSYLSRAKEYYNPDDDEACGTISYLLWGGEEMLRWTESTLNQIEKDRMAFSIESEERRLITGPAMIAEKPIMRRAEDGSTYYVKFSKETIRKAVKLWALQNKYNAVNAEHANPVGGVYLMESWVTDESRGIAPPKAWADAADGSWFLTYYVENNQVWQDVKDGKFRGFSIEGYFTDKPAQAEEETMSAIAAILAKCDNLKFETLSEMSAINKLNEIKKLLGFSVEEETPVKFAESTLVDGTVIRFPGDEIAMLGVGAVLEVQTPEGEFVPAPDGTHETAEGYLVTTEGGIVTEIVEKANDEEPAEELAVDQFAAIREEYSAKFAEQQTAIEKLTAAIERLTNAQAKTVEVIEQFSVIPAADPVKKVNGLRGEAARRDEQLEKFAAAIKKIKNAQ